MALNIINAAPADIDALALALTYLNESPAGAAIIQQAAENNITIRINHNNDDSYEKENNIINWDPTSALTVNALTTTAGNVDTTTVGVQSAALGLLHEAAHATDPNYDVNRATPDPLYDNAAEKYAAQQEDTVAGQLGETERFNHGGFTVQATNPTEHTSTTNDGSLWLQRESDGSATVQGTFQQGTYPQFAPTNNDGGSGTLTIDGPGITVNPGPNRAVDIDATGVRVTDDHASINLSPGASATIIGASDHITAGSGASLSLTGDNNTLILTASSAVNLTGAGESVSGSGATVTLGANSSASFTGSGNTINASQGDVITGNNAVINVAQGASVTILGSGDTIVAAGNNTISVSGDGDTINLGANSSATLYGSNDTLNMNGNNSGYIASGSGNVVNNDVAGDAVNLGGNTSTTITGSGGYFGIVGTGVNVTASNETANTLNGVSFSLSGSGDSVFIGANSSATLNGSGDALYLNGGFSGYIASGTGNVVYNDVAGDAVNLGGNTSTTITGAGGYFGIVGTGVNVTASNETANTLNGVSFSLSGNGDSVFIGANSSATLNGSGDALYLNGGFSGYIASGNGNVVYNDVAGDAVNLGSNTSTTITGSGGYFGIVGTGVNVTASNETANTINGVSFTLSGSGDNINLGANSSATLYGSNHTLNMNGNDSGYIASGSGNVVNNDVAGDAVNLGGNTSTTITGSGGYFGIVGTGVNVTASNESANTINGVSFSLSGSGDTVNVGANSSATLTGSGDTLNTNGGFSGAVVGGGDVVNFGGTGNSVTLYGNNSQADIVNNDISSDNVALMGSMTAEVYGNSGHISLNSSNETLSTNNEQISGGSGLTGEIVNGVSDTLTAGNGFSATIAGANDTVITNNSHILLISGDSNDQIHGDNDIIVAQPQVTDSIFGNSDTFNGRFGNFDGDPGAGGDDGSADWDFFWPDDPIVLNLDGGPVQTQALQTSSAFFDMQNNGQKVHTGWVTAGEGLLVYDPNGGNTVTGDRDLVAGFDALKVLAEQVDGASSDKLSPGDALWGKLKVWVDPTGTADFQPTSCSRSTSSASAPSISMRQASGRTATATLFSRIAHSPNTMAQPAILRASGWYSPRSRQFRPHYTAITVCRYLQNIPRFFFFNSTGNWSGSTAAQRAFVSIERRVLAHRVDDHQ
jgi:hypothetical protein